MPNVPAWSKGFWDAYTHLKHNVSYDPDPQETWDLAVSGRYLLAASLLDRAAGTRAPSSSIFRHYWLNRTRDRLRERFA
jgi:hypothetical protein